VGYDVKCGDLAREFLSDNKNTTEDQVVELAQRIQDAIEDYLQEVDDEESA
jgi:hypothetical protein